MQPANAAAPKEESHIMDIGTIIITVVAIIAGLALFAFVIWAIVALVAVSAIRKTARELDTTLGLDPDLRSTSIRQQHERVKRWGTDS